KPKILAASTLQLPIESDEGHAIDSAKGQVRDLMDTAAGPSDMEFFNFLRLPTELRCLVYEFYFEAFYSTTPLRVRVMKNCKMDEARRPLELADILFVNRQV